MKKPLRNQTILAIYAFAGTALFFIIISLAVSMKKESVFYKGQKVAWTPDASKWIAEEYGKGPFTVIDVGDSHDTYAPEMGPRHDYELTLKGPSGKVLPTPVNGIHVIPIKN